MQAISCERTRALVSSSLDGRLHELERRFLDAHLARCDDCASFASQARWFTEVIRSTPLEPAPPVVLPRLTPPVRLRSVASVAAAAFVLVAAANLALTVPVHETSEHALVGSAVAEAPLGVESLQKSLRDDLASGRLVISAAAEDRSLGAAKPVLPATG